MTKAKQGRLPENLGALVPEFLDDLPADPFDGKPMRYRVFPDGFAVYAVGENCKDDGGEWRDGQWPLPDVGFRVRWRRPAP